MKKIVSLSSCADPSYIRRCDEINKLFDAVAALNSGLREWEIFQLVFKDDSEAREHFSPFLKNVGECPPEVLTFCRKLLAEREKAQQPPGA